MRPAPSGGPRYARGFSAGHADRALSAKDRAGRPRREAQVVGASRADLSERVPQERGGPIRELPRAVGASLLPVGPEHSCT